MGLFGIFTSSVLSRRLSNNSVVDFSFFKLSVLLVFYFVRRSANNYLELVFEIFRGIAPLLIISLLDSKLLNKCVLLRGIYLLLFIFEI